MMEKIPTHASLTDEEKELYDELLRLADLSGYEAKGTMPLAVAQIALAVKEGHLAKIEKLSSIVANTAGQLAYFRREADRLRSLASLGSIARRIVFTFGGVARDAESTEVANVLKTVMRRAGQITVRDKKPDETFIEDIDINSSLFFGENGVCLRLWANGWPHPIFWEPSSLAELELLHALQTKPIMDKVPSAKNDDTGQDESLIRAPRQD